MKVTETIGVITVSKKGLIVYKLVNNRSDYSLKIHTHIYMISVLQGGLLKSSFHLGLENMDPSMILETIIS